MVRTGDAIAIGPHPAECLDLLLIAPRRQFVMGNHEACLVNGPPKPQPSRMSDGEVAHPRWTHARLDPELRSGLATWPDLIEQDDEGVTMGFGYDALDPSGQDCQPLMREAPAEALNDVFASWGRALFFYGHDHRASDQEGRARYVNPGWLGCRSRAVARYFVVAVEQGEYQVAHRAAGYGDWALLARFERRDGPKRDRIYRTFLGGRFGTPSRAGG